MRAVVITVPGEPDVLEVQERTDPMPGPGEVLIKVFASGINRPDVMQRKGKYPPPPGASDLPGLEIAGVIVALGKDCFRWKIGERVCAL
ncbi:MAG: NAD(P)H-quinone oxidoreductase, partial [Marivirga sp.]|nr:NAD(P)H-quinone oxidoreductase [Marivirga sp.]